MSVAANADPAGRLRVCFLTTHYAEYGLSLAAALAQHAEVLVVASEENVRMEMGSAALAGGAGLPPPHVLYRTRSPLSIARQAWALVRAVRRFAPDVIHVQEDSKDVLALALPLLPRRPLVLTMHDPRPHAGADTAAYKRSRHAMYFAQLRRRADAMVVHGQRLVDEARQAVDGRPIPITVAPHGPLGHRGSGAPAVAAEPGRCLFFGRIQAYKGLDLFVAAIERLADAGVPVRGVVAGRGPALEPLRVKLSTDDRFELIDTFLTPQQAVQQFQRAQVVLMPYREATQSGVAAFAMGVGRPVVAFDVGALRESVIHGETGLLAPAGDLQAFVGAAEQVLTNGALARELGAGALALGRGAFSWDAIAHIHLGLYRELSAAPRR